MQRYNMVEMQKIPEGAAAIGVREKVTNLTKTARLMLTTIRLYSTQYHIVTTKLKQKVQNFHQTSHNFLSVERLKPNEILIEYCQCVLVFKRKELIH